MCRSGGGCCQKGGAGTKLARSNLRKGFYVQDVLPAQMKTFMLGKEDWKVKNTALCLLLHLMF